jgi:hypothetical protein
MSDSFVRGWDFSRTAGFFLSIFSLVLAIMTVTEAVGGLAYPEGDFNCPSAAFQCYVLLSNPSPFLHNCGPRNTLKRDNILSYFLTFMRNVK